MAVDPGTIAQWRADAELVQRVGTTRRFEPGVFDGMDRLAAAGVALLAEREEMLALLREIQWADNSGGEYTPECPCCAGTNPDRPVRYSSTGRRGTGHMSDCRLAAFIGGK